MINDELGKRMKDNYEMRSRTYLTRRTPVIIRLDGVAFHTFTRGFNKPFDEILNKTMQQTMKFLCQKIQGCVLGYTQSDEISLLLIDYKELNTDAWYDYQVQKIVSVAASLATLEFNRRFNENYLYYLAHKATPEVEKIDLTYHQARNVGAIFDARCYNMPKEEVANYFLWRQLDAERNSVNSLAQSLFSHKDLQKVNLKDTITKCEVEGGVSWDNLSTTQKRGCCCKKFERVKESNESKIPTVSTEWKLDLDIPKFVDEGRKYIEELVYIES